MEWSQSLPMLTVVPIRLDFDALEWGRLASELGQAIRPVSSGA